MQCLEILEYNFCSLNVNTKRNIEERSLISIDVRESINTTNEVNIEGYAIKRENSSIQRLNSEGILLILFCIRYSI